MLRVKHGSVFPDMFILAPLGSQFAQPVQHSWPP